MRIAFILLGFFMISSCAFSQENTVGLLAFTPEKKDGFVLFSPIRSRSSYLINTCGQVINKWDTGGFPERMAYLTPEGNLVRTTREKIEVYDWDNQLLWAFDAKNNDFFQHHDITVLPNGNVIYIANEFIEIDDLEALGKIDLSEAVLSERLIEIQPNGLGGADVVWEWSIMDHTIQDIDSSLINYGKIEDHPERININYLYQSEKVDWIHLNSIMYNPETDLILISSRNTSELYVIDHSTSTAQAQSSTGGNFGKGGDFLWRWGNPQVYHSAQVVDRKLYGQHDARWILEGANAGKISVFNNGDQRPGNYSSVHIIDTSPFQNGVYQLADDKTFLPSGFEWSFDGQLLNEELYSFIEGGFFQINENQFLISESISGKMYIIDADGNVLWAYRNPNNGNILNQFEDVSFGPDYFKAQHYNADYFTNSTIEFIPTEIIENVNQLSIECVGIVSTNEQGKNELNPKINIDIIAFNETVEYIAIHSMDGKQLKDCTECAQIAIDDILSGTYVLKHLTKQGQIKSTLFVKI